MNLQRTLIALSSLGLIVSAASLRASEPADDGTNLCEFATSARFVESAPRDRFLFENTATAAWHINALTVDLSTSAGNLIFDITADGAGVEVFQPFRGDGGSAVLAQNPVVSDGDQSITLAFTSFKPNDDYQFSIDIDDQLANSDLGQIRVSSGEIEGTGLHLQLSDGEGTQHLISGVFDASNRVVFTSKGC